jgi:hypothetical protein
MKSHINRQFVREVEKAFSALYPYLKMEMPKTGPRWMSVEEDGIDAEKWQRQAQDILVNELGIKDELTVGEFETRLNQLFGIPIVILRRSGNFYIATTMTRTWTLKEQNDHGRELTGGPNFKQL